MPCRVPGVNLRNILFAKLLPLFCLLQWFFFLYFVLIVWINYILTHFVSGYRFSARAAGRIVQ